MLIIGWKIDIMGKVMLARLINSFLNQWVTEFNRKPLLLRGARQVGKTFAVRQLGKQFQSFIEINCEEEGEKCQNIFEKDLNPERIVNELSLLKGQRINPGETLLFIDEIQIIPRAILALRYFYEKIPNLHVIAAGSLLEFALEKVGVPVGRIDSFYMYPLTWLEFLLAKNETLLFNEVLQHELNEPMPEAIHNKLLNLMGEYFAIGGMPKVVQHWIQRKDPLDCFKIQNNLLDDYRQDFEKYARKHQIKYVEKLFGEAPRQLGKRFKFSQIQGDFRKRELEPCFDLLVKAGVLHPVYHSSAQGVPLGAEADLDKFKVIFLDIGLVQTLLGLDLKEWFLDPLQAFVNQGNIVESFVGQEILAYSHAFQKKSLYYWQRELRTSQAEIDYLIQQKNNIIPIEVKSGTTGSLKSLTEYVNSHPKTAYSLRFSAHNYSEYQNLRSYPLYAIAKALNVTWIEEK